MVGDDLRHQMIGHVPRYLMVGDVLSHLVVRRCSKTQDDGDVQKYMMVGDILRHLLVGGCPIRVVMMVQPREAIMVGCNYHGGSIRLSGGWIWGYQVSTMVLGMISPPS